MSGDREREAIERLMFEYSRLVDTGDFEALADLLSEAELGADGSSQVLRGRSQVLEMFRSTVRLYEDGTPRTKHATTNVVIDVDERGSSATASSYFTVLQATSELPLQVVVAGRYFDRFERRDGRWRFKERRFATDLVGDLSAHFLRSDPVRVLRPGESSEARRSSTPGRSIPSGPADATRSTGSADADRPTGGW